jgi:hypothetical protein
MENVQRLSAYHAVGLSDPKWETPYLIYEGEDIVWSIWRHIAARHGAE